MPDIQPPMPDDLEHPTCPECGVGVLESFLGFEYDWNCTPWLKCTRCGLKIRASQMGTLVRTAWKKNLRERPDE